MFNSYNNLMNINNNNKINITTTNITSIELSLIKKLLPNDIFNITDTLTSNTKYLLTYRIIFNKKIIEAKRYNIPIIDIQYVYDNYLDYNNDNNLNDSNLSDSALNGSNISYNNNNDNNISTNSHINISKIIDKYILDNYEGVFFSTSGINNNTFKNYIIVQGGIYSERLSKYYDFIISDYNTNNSYYNNDDSINNSHIDNTNNSYIDNNINNSYIDSNNINNLINSNLTYTNPNIFNNNKIKYSIKYNIPIIPTNKIFDNN